MKFLEFFRDNDLPYPYFTDWVKCGPSKTTEKETIEKRKFFCEKTHLVEEIKILQPKKIFCMGKLCHDNVIRLLETESGLTEIISKENVVKLTHFSVRAPLPLTPEDKKKIWQLEMGLIKSRKEAIELILSLEKLSIKIPK